MNYSILLIFEKPDAQKVEGGRQWKGFATNMADIASKNKDIEILGENVLLLSLQNSLQGIADVVSERLGLKYRYTILDEKIEWHGTASLV